jgi:putative nucleotidyltransferase with HDIG domain
MDRSNEIHSDLIRAAGNPDRAERYRTSVEQRTTLLYAALLHDVGKPRCAEKKENGDGTRYLKHDLVGAKMAKEILSRMRLPNKIVDGVCELVGMHMNLHFLPTMKNKASIRKLIGHEMFELSLMLGVCDTYAAINGDEKNEVDRLLTVANEYRKKYPDPLPQPIITGDSLIDAGLKPGPAFKKALEVAYNSQLSGELDERRLLNMAAGAMAQYNE